MFSFFGLFDDEAAPETKQPSKVYKLYANPALGADTIEVHSPTQPSTTLHNLHTMYTRHVFITWRH